MSGPKPIPVTEEMIKKAESLAAQGLTMEQIASVLGMGTSTLYFKQEEHPELQEAIKRGRHKGVASITNALFNKAKGGDNTAMIFYLKNRDPENWKDKREYTHTGPLVEKIEREVIDPKNDNESSDS